MIKSVFPVTTLEMIPGVASQEKLEGSKTFLSLLTYITYPVASGTRSHQMRRFLINGIMLSSLFHRDNLFAPREKIVLHFILLHKDIVIP
jgi:hypothetical protein